MTKRRVKCETHIISRKDIPGGRDQLLLALAAMVNIIGHEVTLTVSHLQAVNGKGLRMCLEDDGGITVWTYDLLDDMKGIVAGPEKPGSN